MNWSEDIAREKIDQLLAQVFSSIAVGQSILKDAFSGKLVPQDPSNEPAAKLLERICAARSDKPNVKRKKAKA